MLDLVILLHAKGSLNSRRPRESFLFSSVLKRDPAGQVVTRGKCDCELLISGFRSNLRLLCANRMLQSLHELG